MENTIWAKARYQYRSDTAENWGNANPILLAGEHGVVIDSNIPHQREKIGDGKTPWNELGWYHGPQGEVGPQGDKGEKGDKGDKGKDGTTPTVDQSYNPESENPQSGTAVAEAIEGLGSAWKKIVDITTTEEVNGIMATVEEFSDIANCKEFVIRVIFPKNTTGSTINLGASRINIGDSAAFYQTTTNVTSSVCETRCHIIVADGLIFSVGTRNLSATPQVITEAGTLIGDRFANENNKDIMYFLIDSTKYLPVGTQLIIYGKKVEIGESVEGIINDKLSDIETLLGGI